MDLLSILLIAVSLSLDCFAVAIAGSISMLHVTHRQVLRISASFGLFQAGMLVIGWLLGNTIVDIIESFAHWVAFGLLALVGLRMIKEAFESDEDGERTDITRGFALISLSIATSIDSLAVGLSLAFLESRLPLAAIAIGSVAFLFTAGGFYFGRRLGSLFGRRAEVIGGIVLIGLGLRIVLTEML
ncbi:MAG: manganese efflux pump [Dehalococcoidia bacterium]|nr:MAG: manganese efflux pump [Dehalococcoidia bacterium]